MRQHADWVPETRFGTWFLGTRIWLRYVLADALENLDVLLGGEFRRFSSIIDVGCGNGQAFPLLQARFNPEALLGLDVDARQIERAARAARLCGTHVDVRVGNASHLDLDNASVDMVFCHQTLHHLLEQEKAVHEFYRVLKPGGVLLLTESCRPFINSILVRTLFRHPMRLQKSADEYLELLRSTGFAFRPESVALPYPRWSRPDFGLREWLGRPARRIEPPLVQVAALRPPAYASA